LRYHLEPSASLGLATPSAADVCPPHILAHTHHTPLAARLHVAVGSLCTRVSIFVFRIERPTRSKATPERCETPDCSRAFLATAKPLFLTDPSVLSTCFLVRCDSQRLPPVAALLRVFTGRGSSCRVRTANRTSQRNHAEAEASMQSEVFGS